MSLSGKGRRTKGVKGEREVAQRFEVGGFEVRGLEGSGDHLIMTGSGLTLHVESKRQERIEILRWSRQAEAEAPQGVLPLVAYRPSHEPWRISMRLDDFVALLLANSQLVSEHHSVGFTTPEGALIGDECPVCAKAKPPHLRLLR